jgi:hypothetical protein
MLDNAEIARLTRLKVSGLEGSSQDNLEFLQRKFSQIENANAMPPCKR